jgi:hypothetical protein
LPSNATADFFFFNRFSHSAVSSKCSFPNPERQTFLLHERAAARASPRMLPCLDEMFRRHRTFQFHFLPLKLARRGAFPGEQTVPQNHRWNFRSRERGKIPGKFPVPHHATHPRKNVEQFPALAADDGLHVAIQTAVRAAGNSGAILALCALIEKRLAHGSPNFAGTEKKFKPMKMCS